MVYTIVTRGDDERRRRGADSEFKKGTVRITREGSREARSWYSGSLCNPAKASAVVRHKYLGSYREPFRNIPSHANPTLPRFRG